MLENDNFTNLGVEGIHIFKSISPTVKSNISTYFAFIVMGFNGQAIATKSFLLEKRNRQLAAFQVPPKSKTFRIRNGDKISSHTNFMVIADR